MSQNLSAIHLNENECDKVHTRLGTSKIFIYQKQLTRCHTLDTHRVIQVASSNDSLGVSRVIPLKVLLSA